MSDNTALIVGRFQPFHNGHRVLFKYGFSEFDRVIVVVGSPTQSYSKKNPFTGGERIEMITRFVNEQKMAGVYGRGKELLAIPVEDKNHNGVWINHIESICPAFDTVAAGNQLVKRLFKDEGYPVRELEMKNREKYRGAIIRERMINGKSIEGFVPESIINVIKDVNGFERIQAVSKEDY